MPSNSNPALAAALEFLLAGNTKGFNRWLPLKPFDRNPEMIQPDYVERVGLATSARRSRGACLHHQCRMPGDVIALRGVSRVTDVQMTGEKKIGSAIRQSHHRHLRT